MLSFVSAYSEKKITPAPSGSSIEKTYGYLIDKKTGKKKFGATGEVDVYQPKQDMLEGTFLPRMIENFTKGYISDTEFSSFCNIQTYSSQDFSDMPKNLAEFLQLQINAENTFNSMRPEVREIFHNDVSEFATSFLDGTLKEKTEGIFDKEKLAKYQSLYAKLSEENARLKREKGKEGFKNE